MVNRNTFELRLQTVYTAVTYVGYIGIMTGVRHGAFSLSGNERFYGTLYDSLIAVLDGAQLDFFTARRVSFVKKRLHCSTSY